MIFNLSGTQTLETCENGLVFDGHGAVHNYCNYNWAVDCGKGGVHAIRICIIQWWAKLQLLHY
jgi:hypothetical protein